MLKIHFLNVGHGDSIIIEYQRDKDQNSIFGVIDSNVPVDSTTPPTLDKLKKLGAENLSFIALTHPHKDHYTGLSAILKEYQGRVDRFYSFPINAYVPGRLKKLAQIYQKIHDETDSSTLKKGAFEFVEILHLIKKHIGENRWEEPNGCDNKIAPEGFLGLDMYVSLPLSKNKGPYFEMIESGNPHIMFHHDLNKISMAFCIKYHGHEIVLAGDGTHSCWMGHKDHFKRMGSPFGGIVTKLPHHGSKHDCSQRVINHIFSKQEDTKKVGIISADGLSHPHPEIFKNLTENNIHPFCTNLSKKCGANLMQFNTEPDLTPQFNHQLNLVTDPAYKEKHQPCQGDICVSFEDNGSINVESQYNNLCPYREVFPF